MVVVVGGCAKAIGGLTLSLGPHEFEVVVREAVVARVNARCLWDYKATRAVTSMPRIIRATAIDV